jgi:predicted ester cyclase
MSDLTLLESRVRRFYAELWNQWRLELAAELLAPELEFRGWLGDAVRGREGFVDYATRVRAAFPDFHNEIQELVVADERVAARLRYSGTHQGTIFGAAPSGDASPTPARPSSPLTPTRGSCAPGCSAIFSDCCASSACASCLISRDEVAPPLAGHHADRRAIYLRAVERLCSPAARSGGQAANQQSGASAVGECLTIFSGKRLSGRPEVGTVRPVRPRSDKSFIRRSRRS